VTVIVMSLRVVTVTALVVEAAATIGIVMAPQPPRPHLAPPLAAMTALTDTDAVATRVTVTVMIRVTARATCSRRLRRLDEPRRPPPLLDDTALMCSHHHHPGALVEQ
jgi:hypothetical protein